MKQAVLALIVIVLAAQAVPAANPARPLASFFPELAGWSRAEKTEIFLPENLYEHINGAAENFLNYDFEQLAVQTYTREPMSISAEIYFHGTPEKAFGIYSSEKPLNGNYFTVGGQAYAEEGVLNFVCDAYYIKLNGFALGPEGAAILSMLAEKIARAIGGENRLPKILEAFPAVGKRVHSERFILNNFLGHDFLHSAYVADYRVDGQDFQLFVIDAGSEAQARTMLGKYAALDKSKPLPEIKPGALTVNDPYNGPMQLFWRGKFICGGNGPAAGALPEKLAGKLPE